MQIDSSFRNIGLSKIVAVSEQAKKLAPEYEKRTGKPFIYFQRGEVGYDLPNFVRDGFVEAFNTGKTKYPTPGGELILKQAICTDLDQNRIRRMGPQNIVITSGGQEALQLVFNMYRGAKVAGLTPCWSCMFDNIMPYTDCEFIGVPLQEKTGWQIDWDLTEKALQQADIFYFNSPHNPTGKVFSAIDVLKLSEMCAKYGVLLVCDEAYKELVYHGEHLSPLMDMVGQRRNENIVVVNTFSKSFAGTGLRIGYIATPRTDLVELLTRGNYSQTAGISTPTQYAIAYALGHPGRKAWSDAFRAEMKLRADTLESNLTCDYNAPHGAFYAFVNLWCKEAETVSCLMNSGIAVVPGSAFGGEAYNKHVRLSFSTLSEPLVAEGAKRFSEVVGLMFGNMNGDSN